MKEPIQDFSHRILGYIETKPNGDKVATDFSGRILGYYRKKPERDNGLCRPYPLFRGYGGYLYPLI